MKILSNLPKAGILLLLSAAITIADADENLGRNQLFVELLQAVDSVDAGLNQ